jgi:hypothetical protein
MWSYVNVMTQCHIDGKELEVPNCLSSIGLGQGSLPCPLSLQPAHITNQIPQPTHFSFEDGGSMFLRNNSIYLQDYTGSTQKTTV